MKTAVLICPGRGTYNKSELGVLGRTFPDPDLLAGFDAQREASGQETLSALDEADRFSGAVHTRGDNASGLIFAASFGDCLSINRDVVEIVAVTGNSMGWYTALACGGALAPQQAFDVVNTMGLRMHETGAGGQVIYPCTNDTWAADPGQREALLATVAGIAARPDHHLALSIDLGGSLVLAGNAAGLEAFDAEVPQRDRFPMRLPGHAGFHSSLVAPVSEQALRHFSPDIFQQPGLPMIDGRGAIWWPGACDLGTLHRYTFGHQVTEPYDFAHAVAIAAREFAPDLFIVAGPGTTLGGSVAQSLIRCAWRGMHTRADFQSRQAETPLLVSMGRPDQRPLVT